MIKNLLTNIYISSRLFVSIGAIASAFAIHSINVRAIIISITFLYFSLALLSYYKLQLGHYLNKYLDIVYFFGFFYFSNIYFYPLSLISVALLSPRQNKLSLALTLESLAFDIYKTQQNIPFMAFLISLQLGTFIASVCPDIVSALKKERHKILNLRVAYKDMLKHLGAWELNQRRHQNTAFVLEKAIESPNFEEFLKAINQKFDVDISINKVDSVLPQEIKKDFKSRKVIISMPKEDFSLVCSIEFANPTDLYNENLILTLEYICGICSLYYMADKKGQTLNWTRQVVA